MTETHDAVITISLLDPLRGDAVQSWEFERAAVIRIGRAETNDVILAATCVSRLHAEFTRTGDNWTVAPLGRNGIVVGGRPLTGATPVGHQTVLRLATNGPYLEFRVGRRRHTHAERFADQQRWAAAREREAEQQGAGRVDVTEIDFLKRREQGKPAD